MYNIQPEEKGRETTEKSSCGVPADEALNAPLKILPPKVRVVYQF